MKTLVISDCHLDDNYLIFLKMLLPFIKQITNTYHIDKIVFLGDIFDKCNLTNNTLFLFKKLILLLKNYPIEILVGNHEKIDNKVNVYDLLLLRDNVKIFNDIVFVGNYIYLPYIFNKMEYVSIFEKINLYIDKNDYDKFFIYSHNDFSTLYKFKNKFFDVESAFLNLKKPVYLINGHNHVPIFKNRDPFYILNIGCAINLNYKDTGLFNNFLLIDDEQNDYDYIFKILQNKNSLQYYTLKISIESDILKKIKEINSDNYKYITLKITSPNIVLSNEYKLKLQKEYNIINFNIVYDLELTDQIIEASSTEDRYEQVNDLHTILDTLNINISEFLEKNSIMEYEKIEILYTLLNFMFNDVKLDTNNQNEILQTIKKYYLKIV